MAVYEKLRVAIDDASWTPISSPINAHRASVRNAGNVVVTIRTDPEDANTEDALGPGVQEVMEFSGRSLAGQPIFYARAPSGFSSILIVTASA